MRLITLLRRVGLGFIPQPREKLEKDDDDEGIEDLDVALLMDMDI